MTSKETERLSLSAVLQKVGWRALKWASDDLKGDREIVLTAVSQCWPALEWASDDLKGDKEVVLTAVSQKDGWRAVEWASDDLKEDSDILSHVKAWLLKVSLISGRSCTLVVASASMREVLRSCSARLGLQEQHVVAAGRLVLQGEAGTARIINSLRSLVQGKMHHVTLVLSAP